MSNVIDKVFAERLVSALAQQAGAAFADVEPPPDMSWLVPGTPVNIIESSKGFALVPATPDKDCYVFVSKFYGNSAIYVSNSAHLDAAIISQEALNFVRNCPIQPVAGIVFQNPHI